MGNVIFDYSALAEAKSYAKKVVTGWDCMDDYKSGIKSKLKSPLDEWRLSGSEPYNHSYVSNAQQDIDNKRKFLENSRTQWIDLSDTIDRFIEFLKDTEDNVVGYLAETANAYTNYEGISGFFTYLSDTVSNFFTIDLGNANGYTRAIFDWGKEQYDDLTYTMQQMNEWFRHGDGRYVLNIVGSVALSAAAIAGVVVSVLSLPFTGGASCSTAMACISVLGVAASSVSAAISVYNTAYTVSANNKALRIEDDPAQARFYGDISKYSDYVEKTDLGSREANEKAARKAQIIDTTQVVADAVSMGCTAATTFGTKSIEMIDDAGNVTKYTKFDFSPKNVKTNTLKTLGFDVKKKDMSMDVVEAKNTTVFSAADDVGDTTVGMTYAHTDVNYKSTTWEKTVEVRDGKKTVTRTAAFQKASATTEYGSVVASNNVVTQEFSLYKAHAEASSTVVDYSRAASSTRTIAAAKAANDSNWKKGFTAAKNVGSEVGMAANYFKASDKDRTEMTIQNIAKKNYLINQLDKYVFKYDTAKDEGYILGDTGKKTYKLGEQMWKNLTSPAV